MGRLCLFFHCFPIFPCRRFPGSKDSEPVSFPCPVFCRPFTFRAVRLASPPTFLPFSLHMFFEFHPAPASPFDRRNSAAFSSPVWLPTLFCRSSSHAWAALSPVGPVRPDTWTVDFLAADPAGFHPSLLLEPCDEDFSRTSFFPFFRSRLNGPFLGGLFFGFQGFVPRSRGSAC